MAKYIKKKNKEKNIGAPLGNKNAEIWTEEKALKIANDLIAWLSEEPVLINTMAGQQIQNINLFKINFLAQNGHSKELIDDLCDKFPLFCELIKKAEQIQESKILQYSILNKLNPIISIFCLKNHHGYRDKKEIEMDSKVKLNFDKEDENI